MTRCGPKTKWTPAKVAKMNKLYSEGMRSEQMGGLLGIDSSTVRAKRRELGFERVTRAWPKVEMDTMANMRKNGYPWRMISERLGRTENACFAKGRKHDMTTENKITERLDVLYRLAVSGSKHYEESLGIQMKRLATFHGHVPKLPSIERFDRDTMPHVQGSQTWYGG